MEGSNSCYVEPVSHSQVFLSLQAFSIGSRHACNGRLIDASALVQGRNVLKKEPMSKDINESDSFLYNSSFHSKFYKVKIGTVSAQKETEPEKQETRQKVPSSAPHWHHALLPFHWCPVLR